MPYYKNYGSSAYPTLLGNAALAAGNMYFTSKKKTTGSKRVIPAVSLVQSGKKAVRNRRRTRSAVGTKPKRSKETYVPGAEYTKTSTALGRVPRHNLKQVWKLLDQNKTTNLYSHRQYTQFAGANGAIQIENYSATSTTGILSPPMHLWEINACPNVVNNVPVNPSIWWAPRFSNPTSTGTLTWANANNLSLEQADGNSSQVGNYPIGSDTLNWMSAKMIFYCPTTLPCRFQIDVVQFKDTRLVPDSTTGVSQFAAAFYQAMVKRFAYSPLETGDVKYQKYLKVLHTQSFILTPKESTEAVNTIFREVNLFMRFNRRCTYDWEDNDKMAVIGVDGQQNLDVNIKTQVHPRARIFLVIRAQSQNAVSYSNTIHPSYDIVLKTSHSQFSA